MKYTKVYIDAIGYEMAPVVVSSAELERRLERVHGALRLPVGQLEALTGIVERRWWEEGHRLSDGAIAAGRRALEAADFPAGRLGALIHGGVCREHFEPATACRTAAALGVGGDAAVHDVGNACLGVLSGMIEVANRIELGQIKAGMVVSCESAREINEIVVDQLNRGPTMEFYRLSLATLTGGSGGVAVLLSDGSFANRRRRRLLGGAVRSAPEHHELCRWGVAPDPHDVDHRYRQFTTTDAASVLTHGVALGARTWSAFTERMGWAPDSVDKVICHQVGRSHRDAILKSLSIPAAKDFSTYAYLGNMGTVSLPLSAALAEEREFLHPGDRVAFLGIGSGLNCMMLGLEW